MRKGEGCTSLYITFEAIFSLKQDTWLKYLRPNPCNNAGDERELSLSTLSSHSRFLKYMEFDLQSHAFEKNFFLASFTCLHCYLNPFFLQLIGPLGSQLLSFHLRTQFLGHCHTFVVNLCVRLHNLQLDQAVQNRYWEKMMTLKNSSCVLIWNKLDNFILFSEKPRSYCGHKSEGSK